MGADVEGQHNPFSIVNVYVPQSHRSNYETDTFYVTQQREYDTIGSGQIGIIIGDMNSRRQATLDGEEETMGTVIYGWGQAFLEQININQDMLDNRNRLVGFCQVHNVPIANATFKNR